jgi:hypothetical protein
VLQAARNGVRILAGAREFSLLQKSRPTLGSTQPPNGWAPGALSGKKQSEREVTHSIPSNGQVKNEWQWGGGGYATDITTTVHCFTFSFSACTFSTLSFSEIYVFHFLLNNAFSHSAQ